jgi:acetyltransferase-like isoleucine patch superfamily enzyme
MSRIVTRIREKWRSTGRLLDVSARVGRHFGDHAEESNPFITIGRHTYGLRGVTIQGARAAAPVKIGNFCSIAEGVGILAKVEHPTDLPSTFPFRTVLFDRTKFMGFNHDAVARGPITIGHDVWIGFNAIILSGVEIGTGAVVGAGAIVTRDVPPYAIVAGNPAKVIRYRFDEELIKGLLASEWWELPDAALEEIDQSLYARDIPGFLQAVDVQKRRLGITRLLP